MMASARFITNELSTVENTLDSIMCASSNVANSPYETTRFVANASVTKHKAYDLLMMTNFNAQGFLDCYNDFTTLYFKLMFGERFEARMQDHPTGMSDEQMVAGLIEISHVLADNCQSQIPAIIDKYNKALKDLQVDESKHSSVASYATHHYKLVRAGLLNVIVDQYLFEVTNGNGLQQQQAWDNLQLARFPASTSGVSFFSLESHYSNYRLVRPFEQMASNVIAYSFLVASNIVMNKFSKTFEKGKERHPYLKATKLFTEELANAYANASNAEEACNIAVLNCKKLILANRLNLVANSFQNLQDHAVENNWSKEHTSLAIYWMFEIAGCFMQTHFENVQFNKYADSIIDKTVTVNF